MKIRKLLTVLFALCFILCACGQQQPPASNDSTTQNQEETVPPQSSDPGSTPDNTPDHTPDAGDEPDLPLMLEELTVELVVEWEVADAILSQLDDLANALRTALDAVDCPVDHVTLTISTAGGFTAQALVNGGVDIAVLPAVDFVTCEDSTTAIALSSEALCETAIVVSHADKSLDTAFRNALFRALTETDSGQEFLAVCRPDAQFTTVSDEALQAVRDYVAELEKEHEA